MTDIETILYETQAEQVARMVLNLPEARNAQDSYANTITKRKHLSGAAPT